MLLTFIIIIITAIEFSLGGSSPYTSNQLSKYYHVKNNSSSAVNYVFVTQFSYNQWWFY